MAPRDTDVAAKAIGDAANELARRVDKPKRRDVPSKPDVPAFVPGLRTQLTLRAMRWFLILFWLAWGALVMFVHTPPTLLELVGAIAGATAICCAWYQFHKVLIIAAIRRVDRSRGPVA